MRSLATMLVLTGCAGEGSSAEHKVPFALTADRGDFLFEWVDSAGEFRTGTKLGDVPAEHRAKVRVEPLSVPPERRAPPDRVYLADLRKAGRGGVFPVEVVPREAFEALSTLQVTPMPALRPRPGPPGPAPADAGTAGANVILYGASWCGACRRAAQYLTSRHIPFVEKDIERDAAARSEMEAKCRAAGIRPSGIPVIDVRGQILQGFSPGRLNRLLAPGG